MWIFAVLIGMGIFLEMVNIPKKIRLAKQRAKEWYHGVDDND
jgi:hypothetical protein